MAILTSNADSKLLSIVKKPEVLAVIPGITKKDIERRARHPEEIHPPMTTYFQNSEVKVPSPTKFELAVMLFLEGIVSELFMRVQKR